MSEASRGGGSEADDGKLAALETKIRELSDRTSEEKPWYFGPLKVKGTVDVIGLVTFVIAIGNLLYTVYDYFGSADVVVFPPYQIVIGSSSARKRSSENERKIVLISAVTQYINRSSSGHSAIIQREFLKAVFDITGMQSNTVQYGPYQIVRTSTPVKDPKKNAPINVDPVADPAILVINPQSAVTHEVLFWPSQQPGCVFNGICSEVHDYMWEKFINDATTNGEYNDITIHINLTPFIYTKASMFSSYGQFTLPTSCVVKLSKSEFELLRGNEWLAPECRWEGQNVR